MPWGAIRANPGNFFDPAVYLPEGIALLEPSKMGKAAAIGCLTHWAELERLGQQAFHFTQVLGKDGELEAAIPRRLVLQAQDEDEDQQDSDPPMVARRKQRKATEKPTRAPARKGKHRQIGYQELSDAEDLHGIPVDAGMPGSDSLSPREVTRPKPRKLQRPAPRAIPIVDPALLEQGLITMDAHSLDTLPTFCHTNGPNDPVPAGCFAAPAMTHLATVPEGNETPVQTGIKRGQAHRYTPVPRDPIGTRSASRPPPGRPAGVGGATGKGPIEKASKKRKASEGNGQVPRRVGRPRKA